MIERLDMELDPHLNIITGETGAGKSILLGALGLLLGNKNESGSLGDATRNLRYRGAFSIWPVTASRSCSSATIWITRSRP
ncbi:MAG: AAA family ATPase [Bacteroidales bacterium]|nr:MAG: AAA family ATPase [Bacteroidales bacterium]